MSAAPQPPSFAKRALRFGLQLCVTVGALVFVFSRVDPKQLATAWTEIDAWAWAGAGFFTLAALSCGLCRWWLLLRAFGAARPPRLSRLVSHYAAGLFYNTFLPGGIAGDVVRGYAVRDAFEPGSAGGFASVAVERALGLAALLGVASTALLVHPFPGTENLRWPLVGAFVFGVAGVAGLASVGRLSAVMPGVLRRVLERIPIPTAWLPLGLALCVSLCGQLAVTLCGHVLLKSIRPELQLLDSLLIVPLAAASSFLPISVAGIGVREALFVQLYARVGVPTQAALAASLGTLLVQAVIAALGGTQLWRAAPTR